MTARQGFLYGLYFLLVFAVLAFVRFPGERLAAFVAGRTTGLFPEVTLEMDGIKPVLPFGISCENSRILLGGLPPIHPDTLAVFPHIQTVFSPEKDFRFSGDWMGGRFQGDLTGYNPDRNTVGSVKADAGGITVEGLAYRGRRVRLNLSFTLSADYVRQQQEDGATYSGRLVLTDVTAKIQSPVFKKMGIDALRFSRIELAFRQDGRRISLTHITATGDVMTFNLSGQITTGPLPLSSPMNWKVAAKGFFQPQPAYMAKFSGISALARLFKADSPEGIPVRVAGPLKSLGVRL